MGLLGTVAMASHQVALQLAALTFMIPVGVAQATSVVVGQAVGRGQPEAARRAVGAGLVTVTAFMTVTAVSFIAIPGPLARIFSNDQMVVAAAQRALRSRFSARRGISSLYARPRFDRRTGWWAGVMAHTRARPAPRLRTRLHP